MSDKPSTPPHIKRTHSKQPTSLLAASMLINGEKNDFKTKTIDQIPELKTFFDTLKLNDKEKESVNKLLSTKMGNKETFILDEETNIVAFDAIQSIFLMTMDGFSDPVLQRDLLLTIPTYTTPKEYLALLLARCLSCDEQGGFERVLSLISCWIKLSPPLFDEDMINTLQLFKESLNGKADTVNALSIKFFNKAISFLELHKGIHEFNFFEKTIAGPALFFSTCKERGIRFITEQITMQHSRAFRAMTQEDLVKMIFNNDNPQSLINYTKLYDMLSLFVSFSTIFSPSIDERASNYKTWVEIAIELKKLNDYFGLFSVIFGLQHRSVKRMKKTVNLALHKCKSIIKEFHELENLTSMTSNFKNYREAISKSPPPTIPFIPCFQKDWVYFRESSPERKDGLISHDKIRKGVELLDKIVNMRNDDYKINPDEDVIKMVSGLTVALDTQKLMQISQTMEADS